MSDFDEQAREVEEVSEAGRRIASVVNEYFVSLTGLGLTRGEALALSRDYQRYVLSGGSSSEEPS